MRKWSACMALAAAMALSCIPAKSAEPPVRAQARAAVLNIAFALHSADEVCAEKVNSIADPVAAKSLAMKCIVAIEDGRDALLVAEKILDAWKDTDQGAMFCAAKHGVDALKQIHVVLAAVGVALPAEIEDALSIASWVGVGCMENAK